MRPARLGGFLGLLVAVLTGCVSSPDRVASADSRFTGPWNLASMPLIPAHTWGARTGLVQEVYYSGEPLHGRPTRVFAYLGRPEGAVQGAKLPGMVLVHGGGGTAFRDWAEHWAKRGYVALAMDLAGNGPSGRLEDGGPDQSDAVKFRNFGEDGLRDMWSYHAVAAVLRGHSLLRAQPEVDASRIGLTGISWGGYLTCIVAGVDSRFRVAVPVYGCGFLGENSYWTDKSLAAMEPGARQRWLDAFDPSRYLGGVSCPILFLNGTTDFAYPLDSYRKSYRLVREDLRHVAVIVDLPHGHIWSFREVDVFVDSVLSPRREAGVLKPSVPSVTGNAVEAEVALKGRIGIREAHLAYTTDTGPWQKRGWRTVPAVVEGTRIRAELPPGRPLVGFLGVTDARGIRTSSEHFEAGQ